MKIGSFNDLDFPASCVSNRVRHFRPLISSVGEYPFDKGKATPHATQQIARTVAVLNVCGQNAHAEQETERVDEDVTLATRDLLARVITLRIERTAPF